MTSQQPSQLSVLTPQLQAVGGQQSVSQQSQDITTQTSVIAEQLKSLSITGATQPYQSVPSQAVGGNKENSKKTSNEVIGAPTMSGPKFSLKGREFGKEITNASSSSTNASQTILKQTHQTHSVILEQKHNLHTSTQGSNMTGLAQNSTNSTHANLIPSKRGGDIATGIHPSSKVVKFKSKFNVKLQQGPNNKHTSQRNVNISNIQPRAHTTQQTVGQLKKTKSTISQQNQQATNQSTVDTQESSQISSGTSSQNKSDKQSNLEKELQEQQLKEQKEKVKQEVADRLKQFKDTLKKQIPQNDWLDMRDPQMIADFAQDVFSSMIEKEPLYAVDHEYLNKSQTEVKDISRGFLIEWIIDVHRKFRLLPETLYVAVLTIDRYLAKKAIEKKQLHLVGIAALLISTKYEEIYPPELKELLNASENKFQKEEVLAMEFDILSTLEFNFFSPSAYRFLQRYRKLSNTANDDQVFFFAQYLCEISLLDAFFLKHTPSQIAAAAFILSAKNNKKVRGWNAEMEKWTKYKLDDLKTVIDDLKQFALEVNPKFIATLKYKFSKPEYLNVSSIPFQFEQN